MLKYKDFSLTSSVEEILQENFWVFLDYGGLMKNLFDGPVKFSAATSIYLRRGHCKCQISLRTYEIDAPAVINIHEGEILQPIFLSEDLEASFCVMSRHFTESLFASVHHNSIMFPVRRSAVVKVNPAHMEAYDDLYIWLKRISDSKDMQHKEQCLVNLILAFFYGVAYKDYEHLMDSQGARGSRLSESFLTLVQQNFREQRFLDFYAEKLGITTKHLSRVVRANTGLSPVEWIERYVILEAKVLLQSSTMTIQQISSYLNFSSQSFFGKHFKKLTGMTPNDFRNQ